jgi:hypothetical protein
MANTSSPRALQVGSIISAKIRIAKHQGVWQPAKLILSTVREIYFDGEAQRPVALCDDLFCPLPSVDSANLPHASLGVGPRIALPDFLVKADPEKQGAMFRKARRYDETAGQYIDGTEARPSFTKLVDGHRVDTSFDDADRIEVKLEAIFDKTVDYRARVANMRDSTADNGWRQCAPWRSQYTRPVEWNGQVTDAVVEHITMVPMSEIKLDRRPRDVEPGIKATGVGEML